MDRQAPPRAKPADFKTDVHPIWCPGCGHFGVHAALTRTFAGLGVAPENLVVVSGIGCSSRLPAYLNAYGFHGVHGRPLPVATGLKLARPELTVLVAAGDGDAFSIGGNHFLHACRRNVDLTYVVMDNEVYGMTKGQPSPTSPADWDSPLAPGGTGISAFRPAAMALAAGANFIARCFSGDPNGLARVLAEAVATPGFSFVHVLSPCVTYRPEERAWKLDVHPAAEPATDDAALAAQRLMADDGLTTGIFYIGGRPAYRGTATASPLSGEGSGELGQIEREFVL